MAEEISDFVSQLRLDDEEEQVLDLETLNPTYENKVSLLLIGRLLTERSYNVDAFKRTITSVWAPVHGLVIRVLSPNIYAFQFFHWRDMTKVLEGRPWCFDNMLILLKEADGDEQPEQVILQHSPFWVRIKNLPFNSRSDEVVRALIGNMGEILEIEEDVLGFGKYRRAKVMLDVSKPLRRYRKIKDRKGKEITVDFAYERLPFFCFACGIMGHSEKDCQSVAKEEKHEKLGWSLSLKATPRKGRTKEMQEESKYKACKKIIFSNVDVPNQVSTVVPCTLGSNDDAAPKDPSPAQLEILEVNAPTIGTDSHAPLLLHKAMLSGTDHNDGLVKSPTLLGPHPHSADFVFSSVKAAKVSNVDKTRAWKRLARGNMEGKGFPTQMDMDPADLNLKRPVTTTEMASESEVSAMKRPKLSSTFDIASMVSAEVGDAQPRLSL